LLRSKLATSFLARGSGFRYVHPVFHASVPVTADAFHDREEAIAALERVLARLRAGAPSWLCILGPRKIGKTSLILEVARRTADPAVEFAVLDLFEVTPLSLEIFRRLALRVLDAVLWRELGVSLEALADRPALFRGELQRSLRFGALPAALRADVLELPERAMDDGLVRICLDLPEKLAAASGITMLVALDEFQELGSAFPGRKPGELLPLVRSIWQRHRRVAYVISGSERTMLTELVTKEHSPFFQHFALMEIGPFSRAHAVQLLTRAAPEDRPIPQEMAGRAVDIIGGNPFYLQLFGETLTGAPPPYDEAALKDAIQTLVFSRTGRLALYFENELDRLVGRSTYLAAVLEALSDGPRRLGEIASAIQATSGATVRYVSRLGDVIAREGSGYRLSDPTFALWLRWRRPGGTVVPMTLIGDEAEQTIAAHLARIGFELVYQSRASRGAFDLVAIRGAHQLGVQVKRAPLPVRFTTAAFNRMKAEGKRFGWHWVVAVVTPDGRALLLDPKKAQTTTAGVSLKETAAIANLLLWIDAKSSIRKGARAKPGRA